MSESTEKRPCGICGRIRFPPPPPVMFAGMVLNLSDIPVGCHVTLTQGVLFWTVSLSSGVECRTVYRNGTTPNEAYTAALKAWREDG